MILENKSYKIVDCVLGVPSQKPNTPLQRVKYRIITDGYRFYPKVKVDDEWKEIMRCVPLGDLADFVNWCDSEEQAEKLIQDYHSKNRLTVVKEFEL